MAETNGTPKDPARDSAAGIQQNLIAGKYKTQEDLVDAYQQLEKKLGEQGNTLGQTQQQLQQVAQAAQQFQQQIQAMHPYAQWSQQYGPQIYEYLQRQAQATHSYNQAQPVTEILTPQEKQQLFQQYAQMYQQSVHNPQFQQWVNTVALPWAERRLQGIAQQAANQNRAATEVLWSAIEGIAPKEALERVKQRQALLLKYANPQTYNPNDFAEESYQKDLELAKHRDRAAELERQLQRTMNLGAPGADGKSASPFKKTNADEAKPTSRHERAQAVFSDVKEKIGADNFNTAFQPGG